MSTPRKRIAARRVTIAALLFFLAKGMLWLAAAAAGLTLATQP